MWNLRSNDLKRVLRIHVTYTYATPSIHILKRSARCQNTCNINMHLLICKKIVIKVFQNVTQSASLWNFPLYHSSYFGHISPTLVAVLPTVNTSKAARGLSHTNANEDLLVCVCVLWSFKYGYCNTLAFLPVVAASIWWSSRLCSNMQSRCARNTCSARRVCRMRCWITNRWILRSLQGCAILQ